MVENWSSLTDLAAVRYLPTPASAVSRRRTSFTIVIAYRGAQLLQCVGVSDVMSSHRDLVSFHGETSIHSSWTFCDRNHLLAGNAITTLRSLCPCLPVDLAPMHDARCRQSGYLTHINHHPFTNSGPLSLEVENSQFSACAGVASPLAPFTCLPLTFNRSEVPSESIQCSSNWKSDVLRITFQTE